MMNSLRTSELLELFLNLGDKPTITEDAVLRADDVALFQLLPLLMAHLQHVGETYGACDRRRADFVRLLHVLRVRMASCRWLKFRFLALAHHPAYAGFWSYVPVHRSHAYVVARHTVNQLVAQVALPRVAAPTDDEKSVHTPGYASVQPEHDDGGDGDDGAPVEAMLADASKLLSFAATSLFHPRCSVRCHTLLYHSVEVRDAFTGANLVDTIVARARVGQRAHAVAVAQKLLDMGVIYAVVARAPTFVDSDRAIYQCRHDILRDADLRFRIMSADGIEISTSDSSRSISSSVDAQRRQQLEQQADGEEKKKNHAIRRVELRLPVDVVDLQSLDFWTAGVFVNDAKKGYHYGFRSVVHPFYSVGLAQGDRNLTVVGNDKELPADASAPACNTLTDTDTDTDADDAVLAAVSTGRNTTSGEAVDSDGPGDVYANVGADSGITMSHPTIRDQGGSDWMQQSAIVSSVVVRKVFSSIAHPMIVELRQPRENGVLTDDEQFVLLPPPVFVKSGDNLMQDLGVQIMFHLFNHMWNTSPLLKPFGKPPFCVTYEVMPTSTSNGLMQAVTGLRSLKDFNWDEWRNTYSVDKDCIFDMVRSAVGSYIGTCIIGGRDRHYDNVLVQNDRYLLHIDFSYVLGRKPPIDGPPISIAPDMETAFCEMGVWDRFVNMCAAALSALRAQADVLVHNATMLFKKAGHKEEGIRAFLEGESSLNIKASDEKASAHLRAQVRNSSAAVRNRFKEFTHEHVVPVWYGMVKKGFPPAKLMTRLKDKHGKWEAARLTTSLQHDGAAVGDHDRVEI